jgi:hypothetical protein
MSDPEFTHSIGAVPEKIFQKFYKNPRKLLPHMVEGSTLSDDAIFGKNGVPPPPVKELKAWIRCRSSLPLGVVFKSHASSKTNTRPDTHVEKGHAALLKIVQTERNMELARADSGDDEIDLRDPEGRSLHQQFVGKVYDPQYDLLDFRV